MTKFVQNINLKTIFTIIIWLLIAWVLSRTINGIGKTTYRLLGSISNNLFQGISQSKSDAEELIHMI